MTPLLYLLGVVVFVLAILASIGLHELGHMIPAKAFGGKVTQYFIGFGPTIWSRQKGETEYGVKAIPVGGYVKIVGMLPPDKEHQAKVEYDEDVPAAERSSKAEEALVPGSEVRVTAEQGSDGEWHAERVEILKSAKTKQSGKAATSS